MGTISFILIIFFYGFYILVFSGLIKDQGVKFNLLLALPILSLIFGIVSLKRNEPKTLGRIGLALSIIAILFFALGGYIAQNH